MALRSFDEFRRDALARGFDEVLERRWPPGAVLETHTHPFDADAPVVEGEMWLDGRHRTAGGTFQLARGVPHAERDGPAGATYWVARRN